MDAGSFLKAAKMKPLWRIFHNVLFHIVFARRGGKDNVPSKDRFVLHNLFLKVKINLPSLILGNWMDCLKQRSFNKVASAHSIPYAIIFSGILRLLDMEKSLNLNRLALYATGEEITRATFNKIRIGDELFPLVRIKSEPVKEASKQASGLAGAPLAISAAAPSATPA